LHNAAKILKRLAAKVSVNQIKGCHEWKGAVAGGYGQIRVDGRQRPAHRVAYELGRGAIAKGLEIDHLCRNPLCVNPDHLEPVTRSENVRRSNVGQATAARMRAKTHCPAGHPYTGSNVVTTTGYRRCRECRRQQALASYHRLRQEALRVAA
jgi:hypothetical protein